MKKLLLTTLAAIIALGAYASKKETASPEVNSRLNSPKHFVENKGQILNQDFKPNPACLFLHHGKDLNVQLRKTGFSYDVTRREALVEPAEVSTRPVAKKMELKDLKKYNYYIHRVDVEFVGCNAQAELIKSEKSADYANYYTAGTGDNGILNVYNYGKVTYRNIYPNIDAEFTFQGNAPKYNFIVRPGGNISDIQLKYEGASKVELQSNGTLLIKTTSGDVTENIPMSFVESSGAAVTVKYAFNNNVISFDVPAYDKAQTLVIDPMPNRLWGTYYGGNDDESTANNVVSDASGNIFCTGWSNSFNNIATNGAHQVVNNGGGNVFDAVAAKFNSNGQIVWGTYYGGTQGEVASCIDMDASGNIFVGGHTISSTNIATPGAYKTVYNGTLEGFLVKFNSSGVRQFGTYFGGSDDDAVYGLVIDGNNDVYLTGYTYSPDGIATNGAFQFSHNNVTYTDAFLIKFSNGGSRLWGTYYGDYDAEHAFNLACDNSNNIYMMGEGWPGFDLLATNGAYQTYHYGGGVDGWLVKFNSSGTRQWATYFGGVTGYDVASDVAFDGSSSVYLAGYTNGDDHIATNGAYQVLRAGLVDGYLAKFSTSGSLSWATYYGGANDEYDSYSSQNVVACDAAGNPYVAGPTASTSGIASAGTYQPNYGGGVSDGYLIKFNPSGAYQWGSYYGGSGEDYALDINFDATGACNMGGRTDSQSGIASGGVYQNAFGGGFTDGFLTKFDVGGAGAAPVAGYSILQNPICQGSCISFFDASTNNPTSWSWSFQGGSPATSNQQNPTNICFNTSGVFYTTLTVTNAFGSTSAYLYLYVDPAPTVTASANQNNVCPGASVTLTGNGASSYVWQPGNLVGQSVTVNPNVTTTYTVTGTDANGCTGTAQVTVNVGGLNVSAAANPNNVCAGTQVTLTATGANNYIWQPGNVPGQSIVVSPNQTTTYTVTGTAGNCSGTAQVTVNIVPGPTITVNGNTNICQGSSTTLTAFGANSYIWQPGNISGQSIVVSPNVTTTYTVTGTTGNCTGSTQVTVFVNPPPTITISGNTIICPGATTTLTANGASTYTWQPGNISGQSIVVSPNVTTTYTVTGVDVNGCVGGTSVTVVVGNPSISISGNLTVCAGTSTTLTANGANSYVWQPGNITGQSITVTPNVTTTYTVTGTAAGGCTGTSSATVTVNPAPPVPVISVNGMILTSSSPTGNQWYMNGNPIPGATGQNLTITLNAVYSVCVTNAYNCTSCSQDFVFNGVGIAEVQNSLAISVSPNPFNESITVKLNGNVPNEPGTIQLTDVLGQEVGNWQVAAGRNEMVLNTGKLPAGIYFVSVHTATKTITRKAIKY